MLPNPFIELWRNPVTTLAALAYALFLASLVIATLGVCWRNLHTLLARWNQNQGPHNDWQYFPPMTWLLRLSAIPLVLAVDALAAAALIWLLT